MSQATTNLLYLVSSVLFIVGIKYLSSPRTARFGNFLGSMGMLVAIGVTLLDKNIVSYSWIVVGLAAGTVIGFLLAYTVKMTQMPQMVALLNGFGGAASVLVAGVEYFKYEAIKESLFGLGDNTFSLIAVAVSILIGGATFTGSVVAFAKLQELISGRPLIYPFRKTAGLVVAIITIIFSVLLVTEIKSDFFYLLTAASCLLGVLLVVSIGGGDMPVVISLLNSYSGMAAMATGFTFEQPNTMLIITGSLVGASGIILTAIMCKAMNRSIWNVVFGGFGQTQSTAIANSPAGTVRSTSAEDIAILLDGAKQVVIVPGYGMAVAQAQHTVKEFSDALAKKGIDVKYGIHPVAGRMPGHMNVLLAEANIPYDQLLELEQANQLFNETDVVFIVGANDITNPAAKTNQSSPLYGMPILDVDKARSIIVLKRGMSHGFAGVDNELYFNQKCMMLFGDAKKSLSELASVVKSGV